MIPFFFFGFFDGAGEVVEPTPRREIDVSDAPSFRQLFERNRDRAKELLDAPETVEKTIKTIAVRAVQAPDIKNASNDQQIAVLRQELERNNLAWREFYANLLQQAIEQERISEIRRLMIAQNLMTQEMERQRLAQEDEEQAILMMVMDL